MNEENELESQQPRARKFSRETPKVQSIADVAVTPVTTSDEEVLTTSKLQELERELQTVDSEVKQVADIPDVRDRCSLAISRVNGIETQIANYEKRLTELEGIRNECRGFSKKAASHRGKIQFSINRLEYAVESNAHGNFRGLRGCDTAILACDWWIENADAKIAPLEAPISQVRSRIDQLQNEVKPLRAEAKRLKAEVDSVFSKLNQGATPQSGWLESV